MLKYIKIMYKYVPCMTCVSYEEKTEIMEINSKGDKDIEIDKERIKN